MDNSTKQMMSREGTQSDWALLRQLESVIKKVEGIGSFTFHGNYPIIKFFSNDNNLSEVLIEDQEGYLTKFYFNNNQILQSSLRPGIIKEDLASKDELFFSFDKEHKQAYVFRRIYTYKQKPPVIRMTYFNFDGNNVNWFNEPAVTLSGHGHITKYFKTLVCEEILFDVK